MNESRRVLHLFANYKWTGPADPAIRMAARLRALGTDVRFAQAAFVHRGGEHRMAEELWRWRLPVVTGLELRKHVHLRSLLRDMRALRAILRRDRFDLVHCHLDADHLLAALAVWALARPPLLVRTLYDPVLPRPTLRARYAFRRTAGVVVPTAAAHAGVASAFGFAGERLLRQEPVTEPRSGAGPDLRARWGLDAGHRLVGITARVQPQRRFDLLWQVARRVCAALPAVRFVLLGRGNERDTRTLVTEPIAALGLQQQVVLPGYLREPDYSAALRALDVFLFLVPGSDGTCRAVREAMATGLPVVATQRGMLPELLGPRPHGGGPVGFACAEDAVPIADRLLELLGDDALRRQLGGNALQLTRDCMDPVQAARALANFYEQLLSQRGGGPLQ